MAIDFSGKLVVAISSRALFDLDASHDVFEQQGIGPYAKYQVEKENDVLAPGLAFGLTQKLLALKSPQTGESLVEVILLSKNSSDTGLRVFNSIQHHQLEITRAAFTSGQSPYEYVAAFGAHLFLSADPCDVEKALAANCAAATIFPGNSTVNASEQLKIAFDGDAVLFSDEAERIFQQQGLEAFQECEASAAHEPLRAGPFKGFLTALHNLQNEFPEKECPVRTALVTARAAPTHERVIRTLRAWGIRIDEALFLGGLNKAEFLKAFAADFYFDDQKGHCESTSQHVATGHVPHGVVNE